VLTHASRQLPSWLIFDVGQNIAQMPRPETEEEPRQHRSKVIVGFCLAVMVAAGAFVWHMFLRHPFESSVAKRSVLMNSAREAVARMDGWNSDVAVGIPSREGTVWVVRVVRATSSGEEIRVLRIEDDGKVTNYSKMTP